MSSSFAIAALLSGAGPAVADAEVRVGPTEIVVEGPGRSAAIVDRNPFRISFADRSGDIVLQEVSGTGTDTMLRPPTTHIQFGSQTPPPPALYAPLGFLVGTQSISQAIAQQWNGNLQSVTSAGIAYSATSVESVTEAGDATELTLATSDPTGRKLEVTISPAKAGSFKVSATPNPAQGVATMTESFATDSNEAFRGFGGRHNALDQRGTEFYNWLQQENLSSGSASGTDGGHAGWPPSYLFPNGEARRLLRPVLVHLRRGVRLPARSPRALALAHGVRQRGNLAGRGRRRRGSTTSSFPARSAKRRSGTTAITGRQPVPPRWALGSIFDRARQVPVRPPESFVANVRAATSRTSAATTCRVDAYRIEGWQFLPRDVLARFIRKLRRRGIHPMLYFRTFVGEDDIGTDSPAAYDEAIEKGYVATAPDGSPYTFISNFNAPGAQIDFTEPRGGALVEGPHPRGARPRRRRLHAGLRRAGPCTTCTSRTATTGVAMHNRLAGLAHRATYEAVEQLRAPPPGPQDLLLHPRWLLAAAGLGRLSSSPTSPATRPPTGPAASGLASLAPDMLNRGDRRRLRLHHRHRRLLRRRAVRAHDQGALHPLDAVGRALADLPPPWLGRCRHSHSLVLRRRDGPDLQAATSRSTCRARPLIMRLWKRAKRTGIPITRPLWLMYPNDETATEQDQEWMLGRNVLVAPVVEQGRRHARSTARGLLEAGGHGQRDPRAGDRPGGRGSRRPSLLQAVRLEAVPPLIPA